MTEQEIFDKVYTHFVVERNPCSVSADGTCMYRGLNGAKCAVGLLIPDEQYQEGMEGMSASMLCEEYPSVCDWGVSPDFLMSLQCAHDRMRYVLPHEVRDAFRAVADLWGLTIPEGS